MDQTEKKAILTQVLNEMLIIVKHRIFDLGLAADGKNIGFHPQGNSVKLVHTGRLKADLQVIINNNNYGIGVRSELSRIKIRDNEKRYRKKIFALTKQEKRKLNELMAQAFFNYNLKKVKGLIPSK
jgi:hypothetical protein